MEQAFVGYRACPSSPTVLQSLIHGNRKANSDRQCNDQRTP